MLDPECLLENLEGWVLTLLRNDIHNSGTWEKLANLSKDINGHSIFSTRDILKFAKTKYPEEALLNEYIKRNITLKHICYLLEKAEMKDTLVHLKNAEEAKIVHQSLEGLIYVSILEDVEINIETSGFPPPEFLWYKESQPLNEQRTNILKIDKFSTNNEGIYLCLIEQYINNKQHVLWSKPVQLCLKQTVPFIIEHPFGTDLIEGEKLHLICRAVAYPEPIYTWFKDKDMVKSGEMQDSLLIEHPSITDAGYYKCIVNNCEGRRESNIATVNVCPKGDSSNTPVIIHHPLLSEENPERSIGQSFSLLCSARCLKNVTFTWIVNGRSLEENISIQHIVTSSSSAPDYSSSLFYTITHDDGPAVRVICMISSTDSSQVSNEVKIKVTPVSGPKEYKAGSKWALLVANTDYNIEPLPPLFTPSSDMQLIAKELSELNFHCLLMTNLNLVEFRNTVKLFSSLIKPGDYAIFCYAGHGLFSGIDLLMPVPDENSTDELETLSSVWITGMLQMNHPALLFMVLDMCRHIHLTNVELPLDTLKIPAQRNCIVLHATSEGYQSLEDPKTSSVLTSSLVQHLRDDVDVVTMTRAVLEDIAHKSQFVRCEQIPKLDVNLCENRSLKDVSSYLDANQERVWATLVELPPDNYYKKTVAGKNVAVRVYCTGGGTSQLVSNAMLIHLEVIADGVPPQMMLALNVKNKIKPLGRKGNKLVYEMNAIHKLNEPLALTVGFKDPVSGAVVDEIIPLGIPGIAKVRIYDKDNQITSLRAKNMSYNIS